MAGPNHLGHTDAELKLHIMKKNSKSTNGYTASISAKTIEEEMQWTKYHSPNGGHGFAAEDGNALWERVCGHKVKLVGLDNEKNGADLLIDGVPVQLKYFKDAYSSIEACFGPDGMYRYSGKEIMVPKDEYDEAVARMRTKITEGRVPGVTDPTEAESMIRKGKLTYDQSLKLKRFGTKESLVFDVLVQAQIAGIVGGISSFIAFIRARREGLPYKNATIIAGKEFGKSGAKVLVSGVAIQQFLRSEVGRKTATITTHAVRKGVNVVCNTEIGRKAVEKVAWGIGGKVVKGAAARTVTTKAIRGNIITSAVVFAIDSIPDTYKLCIGKLTAKEYGKSRATGAIGIVGGSAGYLVGTAVGTAIMPGVGSAVGGFVGGILGGLGGSSGSQRLLKSIR